MAISNKGDLSVRSPESAFSTHVFCCPRTEPRRQTTPPSQPVSATQDRRQEMPITIEVLCENVRVNATLTLSRKETIISTALKKKLNLDSVKHRMMLEEDLGKYLYLTETQVCLFVTVRNRKLAVAASVAAIGPELLIGTDAMSRFGLTLHWEDQLIPLPRKRPVSRDWVLGAFIEIERNMRGPQRGTPTCPQCKQKGHLRIKCHLETFTQNLAPSEDGDRESDHSDLELQASPRKRQPGPPARFNGSNQKRLLSPPSSDPSYQEETSPESEGPDSPALPIPPPSPASTSDADDNMEC